jgi:DNA-binding response OmpR family regulator
MEDLSKIKVLVVDDDNVTRHFTLAFLKNAGFQVQGATSGEEGLAIALENKPDVIVLDILMPGMNGFETCVKLHEHGIDSIIIMLTVRSEDIDKIHGLEIGADDYMVKPYNPDELVARIKAILRRWLLAHHADGETANMGLSIDYSQFVAFKNGVELDLTRREITLLGAFLRNPGKLLTREDLFNVIYGESHFGTQKVIDVYIKRIRAKIESDPQNPLIIKTVWGKGYVCGDLLES